MKLLDRILKIAQARLAAARQRIADYEAAKTDDTTTPTEGTTNG